jgi:mannitol/fructose-specific phosphotransferase system IIA component (Ntr-type)
MDFFKNVHAYMNLRIGDGHHLIQNISRKFKEIEPTLGEIKIRTELNKKLNQTESYFPEAKAAIIDVRVRSFKEPVLLVFHLKDTILPSLTHDLEADLVFVLAYPGSAVPKYLQALSKLSRMLKTEGFGEKIRGATSSDAVLALLWSENESLKAA